MVWRPSLRQLFPDVFLRCFLWPQFFFAPCPALLKNKQHSSSGKKLYQNKIDISLCVRIPAAVTGVVFQRCLCRVVYRGFHCPRAAVCAKMPRPCNWTAALESARFILSCQPQELPHCQPFVTTSQFAIRALSMACRAEEAPTRRHPGRPDGHSAEISPRCSGRHDYRSTTGQPQLADFVIVLCFSNGHGSMLILFRWLQLTGYDLSIDELKNFVNCTARPPAIPEYGYTPGRGDTTEAPLGQGSGQCGSALPWRKKIMARSFNKGPAWTSLTTTLMYFMGDGCLNGRYFP